MTVLIILGASAVVFGAFGSVIVKDEKKKNYFAVTSYIGLSFLLLLSFIAAGTGGTA